MENRYQKFLKNTLKPGLLSLQQNPLLTEVNGIPLSTFNILVRAFRAGLSDEFKIILPHDLKNLTYLQALLDKVEILLSPGIPEETTLANAYSLPWLMENYENAQKVGGEQKKWQVAYEKQVADYNQKLIAGVQAQLEEKLPSLPKEEIIKPLAVDIARTVKEALPYASSPEQAEELVQRVTQVALKTYASTAKEIQENVELPAQIAQTVAAENEADFQELTKAKTTAPLSPLNIQMSLEEAVLANLPAGVYRQNPQIVKEIATQTMGRLSLPGLTKQFTSDGQLRQATLAEYQAALTAEVSKIIASPKIQESIKQTGITITPEKQGVMIAGIASQVSPTAMVWSGSAEATQFGVTMGAGFGAAQAAATAMGAIGGIPTVTGGAGQIMFPEGSLGDILNSSGTPLHLFTALASPRGLQNLGQWTVTGGWIRTPLGFVLDSFPGMPKLDYLDVGLNLLFQTQGELKEKISDLSKFTGGLAPSEIGGKPSPPSDITRYELFRDLQEAEGRLRVVDGIIDTVKGVPGFDKVYNFYYGGPGKWLLHPFRSLQQWAINKNIFAGLGVSAVTDILSLTSKYGGPGFAYAAEEYLKQFGVLALKFGLTKTGLYEIVGLPGHRHFVFKPTHELAVRAQKWLMGTGAGKAVKNAVMELLKKLGLDTLFSGLSGGTYFLFKAALWIVQKTWKFVSQAILGLLVWLFTSFDVLHALASIAGGLVSGGILGGIFGFWGWFFGFLGGTALTAIALQFFKGMLASFGKALASGFGGLLSGITGLPSLAATASPILGLSAAAVGIPTGIYFFVVSSAFEQQGQPAPVQSEYVTVSKGAEFSGKIGDPINYVLKVVAPKTKIAKIKITDTTTATCQGTPPEIPVRTFTGKIPLEILPGAPLVLTYQVPTDPTFNDCLITNAVQVEVDVPELQIGGEKAFTTNNVSIGNPPVVMPIGPPLKGNVCLSGYDFNEREPNGTIHNGIDLFSDQPSLYSPFLKDGKVLGVCKSPACLSQPGGYSITFGVGPYVVYAGHLASPPLFNVGDTIPASALFGTMGSTGNSSGPHVHYIVYLNGKVVDPHSYGVNPPKCP